MSRKTDQKIDSTSDSPAISVNEFENKLKNDVENICRDLGKSYNVEQDRGIAFQMWCAELLATLEGCDVDPGDTIFTTNDLKIDIAFSDDDTRLLVLAQTKFVSVSRRPDIAESEVHDFFNRHEVFLKEDAWLEKHASDELFDLLSDYRDRLKNGWKIKYFFISTGQASGRVSDLVKATENRIKSNYENISFELWDFYRLKELYIQAQSIEEPIAPFVDLQFAKGRYFFKDSPYRTILSIVKGNAIVNLYRKERDRLFAHNVRSFLGKRVNKTIVQTATDCPADFYYFNNGISAICTEIDDLGNDKYRFHHFQIINGAQTVGSLHSVRDLSGECEVILRITVGASVSTEKGINADIIRYNNTQNVVKASDFRANDKIQLWIEKRFQELKPRGAISQKIKYVRKRTSRRVKAAVPLKLEDLAKIRYAFIEEPTQCVADPRSLWTLQEDDGLYEKAFGVNGELVTFWMGDEFDRALLAVLVYNKIMERTRELIRKDKAMFYFLQRLRFWSVSLAALHLRERQMSFSELLESQAKFSKWFEEFWKAAFIIESNAHDQAQNDRISNFALVRSETRWDNARKSFIRQLKAGIV